MYSPAFVHAMPSPESVLPVIAVTSKQRVPSTTYLIGLKAVVVPVPATLSAPSMLLLHHPAEVARFCVTSSVSAGEACPAPTPPFISASILLLLAVVRFQTGSCSTENSQLYRQNRQRRRQGQQGSNGRCGSRRCYQIKAVIHILTCPRARNSLHAVHREGTETIGPRAYNNKGS